MKGIYVAGDWAGHEELLADAAVASEKRVAEEILKSNRIILGKEG